MAVGSNLSFVTNRLARRPSATTSSPWMRATAIPSETFARLCGEVARSLASLGRLLKVHDCYPILTVSPLPRTYS
jgi:hypothetical protein